MSSTTAGSEEWWFKDKEGVKTGPTPVDLLEGLWLAGELDGMTPVWKEGMADYLPIAECPSLRAALQGAAGGDDDEEFEVTSHPFSELMVFSFSSSSLAVPVL